MLTVILNILSVIGLILLILLAVILSVILLVLFVPICYKIKGQKQEQIEASVKANWLFGFLRLRFFYPTPGRFIVKILFFTVYDSGKEEKPKRSKKKKAQTTKPTETSKVAEQVPVESNCVEESPSSTSAENPQPKPAETQQENRTDEPTNTKSKFSIKEKLQNIKKKLQNLQNTLKNIKENIDYYKNLLQEDDTKQLFKHVLKHVGRVLKSIRPRKLKVNLLYGTGSPDTTGYIYAVYGMLCSYLGKHVIVEPNFDAAILKGDIYAAGHITIAKILWHAFKLALDKKLWNFISKVKKES